MRLDAGVVGHGVLRAPEAHEAEQEEPTPPDEQDEHEDVRPADQAVDLPAMSRSERRQSEPFSHEVPGDFCSSDHSSSRSDSAMRLARLRRYRKNATKLPCTTIVIASSTRTPSLEPSIIDVSSAPKHTGHAS